MCFGSMSLVNKTLSGPGYPEKIWSYNYSENAGRWQSESNSNTGKLTGRIPPQINDLDYKRTTVNSPDGSKTVYYHNRDFTSALDGQLVVTEIYDTDGSTLLKRSVNSYEPGLHVGKVN